MLLSEINIKLNFLLLGIMQIMLLRQVWGIFTVLFTIIDRGQYAWQRIYQNPSCFYTNLEYSKLDEASNLMICYLKIRWLSLMLSYFYTIHPKKSVFSNSHEKKGKVIKQKLSPLSFYLTTHLNSEHLHMGQYNSFLRSHSTHDQNTLIFTTLPCWKWRKVSLGSKGRDITPHLDGVVARFRRVCGI